MGLVLPFPPTQQSRHQAMNPPEVVQTSDVVEHRLPDLVAQIAGQHEAALSELYDLTVGKVLSLATLMMNDPEDAEEVTCDVYTQVWHGAGSYDGQRSSVMTWLLMICRSRALDALRRRRTLAKKHERIELEEPTRTVPPPDELLNLVEEGTAVHAALAALGPVRRQLVALAYFRGMTHEEIAASTGMPIGTVKSHIRRALKTMRDHLDQVGD